MSWLLIIGLKNAILVAPLALLALGIGRYCKRPALAHLLWLIVLVKLLTPPLVDVPVGWRIDVESWLASSAPAPAPNASPAILPPRHTIAAAPAAEQSPITVADSTARTVPPITPKQATNAPLKAPFAPAPSLSPRFAALFTKSAAFWTNLAGAAWALGSGIVVVLLVLRAWRFQRFVRLAARVDDRLANRVAVLARSVGLGTCPRVVVVDGVVSPMLWGVGSHTRLIFPAKLAERLDDAEIDSLLLHELAHFARGDHWVRLLELAAHVLYWWHPIVWCARREIEAAEEQCCDAWVIQHQHGSRRSYAEALLTTIDFLCEPATALPPAACGLGDVPLLRSRLTQIMKGQLAAGLSRGAQAFVLCVGVVISPLQPALWATSSRIESTAGRLMPSPPPTQELPPAAPASEPESAIGSAAQPSSDTDTTNSSSSKPAPPAAAPPITSIPLLWSAQSPDGNFRLEARKLSRTTLVRERTTWRLDLSSYEIKCASFAPDSRSFITGHADGTVRWWDCATGGLLNSMPGSGSPVKSVAFGPNQQAAAGCSDGSVTVWDLVSGEMNQLTGLLPVACVRWSRKGDRLAIGLGDWSDQHQGGLLIWDPQSPVQPDQHSLSQPVGALSWLDDTAILIGRWDGMGQVFRNATGDVSLPLPLDKATVSAAAWSPDCPLVLPWQARHLAAGIVE